MADADTGVNNLFQGMMAGNQQWEKAYANGKIADSMVKTNPELLQQLQMTPEQFGSQSATDKASAIAGIFQAQGAQQHAQLVKAQLQDIASQAQERASIGRYRDAMGNKMQAQDDEDAGTGQLVKDALARMTTGGSGGPPPGMSGQDLQAYLANGGSAAGATPSPDVLTALSQAAQANPKIGGRSLAPAIDAMTRLQAASVKPPPVTDMTPLITDGPFGSKVITDRKTGASQVVQAPKDITPQTDEDGNTVGYSVPNGKGGFTFRPTAPTVSGALKPMLTPDGKPIYGMGVDEKGSAHNFLENLKADPDQPNTMDIATSSRNLANYLAAGAKGAKTASVDDSGNITKVNPMWGGTPIKDLIKGETTKLNSLRGGNQALTAGGTPTVTGRVRVIGPDGKAGSIPSAQLQQALANGYKQVQ